MSPWQLWLRPCWWWRGWTGVTENKFRESGKMNQEVDSIDKVTRIEKSDLWFPNYVSVLNRSRDIAMPLWIKYTEVLYYRPFRRRRPLRLLVAYDATRAHAAQGRARCVRWWAPVSPSDFHVPPNSPDTAQNTCRESSRISEVCNNDGKHWV